jgi:hypothetical protein
MVKACYQVIYGYQDVIMCHRDVLSCDIYINTTDAIDISQGLMDASCTATTHNVRRM